MHHSAEGAHADVYMLFRQVRTELGVLRRAIAHLSAHDDPAIRLHAAVEAWPYPALLVDRHRDILAASTAGAELWGTQNGLITSFEHANEFAEWASHAPSLIARLRADIRTWPDDHRYRDLVDDLLGFDDFRTLWTDPPPAAVPAAGVLTYEHDGIRYEAHHLPAAPGHPDELRAVLAAPSAP